MKRTVPRWYLLTLIIYGIIQLIFGLQYLYYEQLQTAHIMIRFALIAFSYISMNLWLVFNALMLFLLIYWRIRPSYYLLPLAYLLDVSISLQLGKSATQHFQETGMNILLAPAAIITLYAIPLIVTSIALGLYLKPAL